MASRALLSTRGLVLVVACWLAAGVPTVQAQTPGLYREVYLGIPGSTLLSFTNVFPPAPDLVEISTNLFETPSNYGDNFGERYRGLLIPPVSGEYVFWCQGQNSGILFLSPDESAVNKVGIAYNLNSALARSWYVFPTQQSTNIYLEAGRRYYVEALHKTGNGDDSFAIGWKLPNGTYEQPMPASHFRPYGQAAVSAPVLTASPTNRTVLEQLSATFRVAVSNTDAVTYRWRRDGTNLPGAFGASLTLPTVTLADHGAQFTCLVSNSFGTATSASATLAVLTDTDAPVLRHAANLSTNALLVVFSEALDPATALVGGNYTLSHGAQITGVQFGAKPHTIVLATTMLGRNTNYTLTVNNLRDRAAVPNTLAANSTTNFVAYLKGSYRQVFADLPGSQLTDLTNSPAYPSFPLVAEALTAALATPAWPTNNYGQRLRALLVPPFSGSYQFQISAHDSATLYLGTNVNANSAKPIATVTTASDASAGQYLVQTNQTSALIPLVGGQQYYLQVLMKSGLSVQSPPDHLSVRWTLPDGTVEDPVPVARLVPSGLPAPVIIQHPQPVETEEGQPVSFSVTVANLDAVTYQWQSRQGGGTNYLDMVGATNTFYYRPAVTLAEDGSSYRCVLVNYLGTTTTLEAALTVTPDATPPALVQVVNNGTNRLVVTFTEPVEPASATNLANYALPGATLSAPVLATNGLTVSFNTTLLTLGSNYTLTVNAVRDRATTFQVIATNSQFAFTVAQFYLGNIGAAPGGVSYTPVPGGVDLTAGQGDFFGTSDAFNYAYEVRRGNFDVKVRVARLDFADTWSVASLMVREDLNTTNKYAALCATPSIAGVFFQYRTNNGVLPEGSGAFPVNYPYTWLRLQRTGSGTTFHGYASVDGETWTRLGTAIITMPNTVYLGFTVSSRTGAATTTAEFRDFGSNTSTNTAAAPTTVEPLGPSSRRTGLAFSEILYNPAKRTDGRKLEFIELHNSNPYFENIGGWRLTGDISYTFPSNTVIPGGGFLVVARVPADVQTVYGLGGILGPYTGKLGVPGTVRLRNPAHAILLEVNYDNDDGWPLAAAGPGHSLVLARASYGENNPLSWAASDRIGGSPGRVDGLFIEPTRNIVINEFLAHTDLPDLDFIELFNRSKVAVDLSGGWLSDDPETNKFRIPDGTIIGPTNFLLFNESQLGFSLNAAGEGIYLVNSNRTRVLDCVGFDGQENGVSTGRTPDGAPTFTRLASKTPGTNNAAQRLEGIVINEIMYNPVTGDDWDEFVEIYNRGTNAVNLTNWRLNKGVDFTFPTNTIIPTNGYIVVGKDVAVLRTSYTNLNLANSFGPYAGTLANSGERLTLDMPDTVVSTNLLGVVSTNLIHILIDDVTYGTGGKWGNWSDGGGSSLELTDPRSDNRLPSNWADSDDTAKSQWTTMSVNGALDHMGGSSSMWNAIQLWLYEAGECLVDNVSVSVTPGTVPAMSVPNGNFNSGLGTGANEWMVQGTHRYSYVENVGGVNGNVLHVVAQDRGDTGANRINKVLTAQYVSNSTATVTASVKWLKGRPEILFRLRGNGLEIPGVMNVPRNLGTPGARNSRFATNAGPAITEVAHSPVLPAASDPIVVTARVHDQEGVASVQLTWRLDPFGVPVVANMVDNGTGQDLFARDGIYTATIPGQADNAMMAFYVSATDSNALVRTTKFPGEAPAKECLVHVGDKQPVASFASYRFWMTDQTLTDWIGAEKVSSEIFKGTFIYGNSRIIYDAGSHYAGSPAHSKLYNSPMGTNCDYQLLLKSDDALLSETSLRIQEPGLFGADRTCQNESLGYWVINQMNIPSLNRRPINVFINGLRRGLIYEDTQRQNSSFNEQWFPDADADASDLYRIGYWYEYGDDLANRSNNEPTLQDLTTTGGAKKLARYRQTFGRRAIKESIHNYTNLFKLVDTLKTTNTGDAYAASVFPVVDVTSFARAFAAERILNNTDLYGAKRIDGTDSKAGAQNSFLSKPGGDKWKFLIWDIDAAFLGTPVDPLFDFTDPPISNLFLHPYVLRTYWQALEDGVYGPLRPSVLHPAMDAKYAAFQAAGIAASAPQQMKDFLGVRRDFILQTLSENKSPFSITANGGANFTNASTLVTLSGAAPFGARFITINGIQYPLAWSSVTNWSVRLPLSGSTNLFTVRGYDAGSNLLANSTRTITVFFNGTVSKPEESLVINEIMFHSRTNNGSYVEIYNRSTNTTFGLGGYRLNGVDFNFPAAALISPLSYVTVVKDTAAFTTAYGAAAAATVLGEYPGGLDDDGETLALVKVAASTNLPDTIISKVKFEARRPWSEMAARTNSGVSLQLVDVTQDHARVSNWEGAADWRFMSLTGVPNGNRLALWLSAAGEVFIDDMQLVLGTVAGVGSNLVKNPSFETNLTPTWAFIGSYAGGTVSTNTWARSGTNSLRLAPTVAGSSSLYLSQDMSPALNTSSNYTLSFWYRPTTNVLTLTARFGATSGSSQITTNLNTRLLYATPGTNNSVARSVAPYPLLWLNEVQPNNVTTLLDNTGTNQPWLELYNSSTNTIDLTGYALSKNYTNLGAWNFPNGSVVLPGQFRVIFADGRPQFTTGAVLHTSFRLDALSGSIVLSRSNQILDYINYSNVNSDVSYGSVPDGQLFTRQLMYTPTPGDTNSPSPAPVLINEWMAANTATITNPITGAFEDWVELYNFSDDAVDLGGYYMTDDEGNKNKWRIPNTPLAVLAPHSFLLVWADGTSGTNVSASALHANFKLSKGGDYLGLFSPNQQRVDAFNFGPQQNNVTQGRFPDGNTGGGFVSMMATTPRTNNVVGNNGFTPALAQPVNRVVNEGALITFTNLGTDADLPAQALTFTSPNLPEGATLHPTSGLFTWQTLEQHGPGVYVITVRVTDNGTPSLFDQKNFQITVNESNRAPVLPAVGPQVTYTNTLLSFSLAATDLDLPAQTISYGLATSLAGAALDGNGLFTFIAVPAQAPSSNFVVITATDSLGLSATQSFAVIINGGLACGGYKGDVVPRGNPNGVNGITDWVQIGLFVAGLATATDACETNRADCAPRNTCGDGILSTIDWVQAGRYAAGLDARVLMQDCAPSLVQGPKSKVQGQKNATLRNLSFIPQGGTAIARGATNCFPVMLDAQGDENGFGFSIRFDTNVLTFISAQRGADATNAAMFLVNTSSVASGVVGIAFILPANVTMEAGRRALADLCFAAKAGSNTVVTPLTFEDAPVAREISDSGASGGGAQSLPANFVDGEVTVVGGTEFQFSSLIRESDGEVSLRMVGPAGVWLVQRSLDLQNWETVRTITNTAGLLEFTDAPVTNIAQRFYRAVQQ